MYILSNQSFNVQSLVVPMMSTASITYLHGLKVTTVLLLAVAFISSFALLPPNSVVAAAGAGKIEGSVEFGGKSGEVSYDLEKKKMVLGSRPPGCANKCLNCRPCVATLVIPVHHSEMKGLIKESSHGEDDSYYLLSWKCRCGAKVYQP